MSIIVGPDTRLLVQGITGRDGSFHTRQMIEYGTKVVGGVTPGKGGQKFDERVPIFNTVHDAVQATGANTSVIYVPPMFAADAIMEAADAGVKLIVAITRRLRETNERVARQSFQTVPSRVAGVLSQLIAEEAIPEERRGITVRMTQADLAQLAGTSRESVSRFLATLERAGVVAVGRGRVTVLEPRRLRAYIF